jgi:hypothetical protein
MAPDLWSDLLDAETDLTAGEIRWLSPLPLWTGILAGPTAWAADLTASYALVKFVCRTGRVGVLHAVTAAALVMVLGGAFVSWVALLHTPADAPDDGGYPRQRARFMAILGLVMAALFTATIVAGAIPRGVLDACR